MNFAFPQWDRSKNKLLKRHATVTVTSIVTPARENFVAERSHGRNSLNRRANDTLGSVKQSQQI